MFDKLIHLSHCLIFAGKAGAYPSEPVIVLHSQGRLLALHAREFFLTVTRALAYSRTEYYRTYVTPMKVNSCLKLPQMSKRTGVKK